jgi:hypothetical protein
MSEKNYSNDKLTEELGKVFDINISDLLNIYPKISDLLAKPSQLDLGAREFFYWGKIGVINVEKAEKGQSPWNRLNLIDILWVTLVKELRKFNIPFQDIALIKNDYYFDTANFMVNNKELVLNELISQFSSEIAVEEIYKFIENPNSDFKKYKPLSTPFAALITQILLYGQKISLYLIPKDSHFKMLYIGNKNSTYTEEEINYIKENTHLFINLNTIVSNFFELDKNEPLNRAFGIISSTEDEIITALRDHQVDEILIKKSHDQTITYTLTQKQELRNDEVKAIKKLLRMNEYKEVSVVLRNDKHIYLENKIKKIIKTHGNGS